MADKNVPYTAPWTDNLKHRPDPNHVRQLQTLPRADKVDPFAAEGLPADPATQSFRPAPLGAAKTHDPQSRPAEPSYYDISILKAPPWKWEIANYFFLGGSRQALMYWPRRRAIRWR